MSESEIAQILAAVANLRVDMGQRLTGVETKVDALQKDDSRAVDDLRRERDDRESADKDHEDRLRKLEQFKWILVGASAAAGGLAGGLAGQIAQR